MSHGPGAADNKDGKDQSDAGERRLSPSINRCRVSSTGGLEEQGPSQLSPAVQPDGLYHPVDTPLLLLPHTLN